MHPDAPPFSPSDAPSHRSRLLQGMARALSERGYAATTVADVVREAAVSRRTFYEHFEDKAACLIALYEAACRRNLNVLRACIDPSLDWPEQVRRGLAAYLGALAGNAALLRALFVEILHLGEPGLAARRRVNAEVVRFLIETMEARGHAPGTLPEPLALAIVGGIHELVLIRIEQGRPQTIPDLEPIATEFVLRVARGAS